MVVVNTHIGSLARKHAALVGHERDLESDIGAVSEQHYIGARCFVYIMDKYSLPFGETHRKMTVCDDAPGIVSIFALLSPP